MNYLPFPDDLPWWLQPSDDPEPGSDLHLALAVIDRLRAVRRLRHQQITVQAQNKVVILEGTVSSAELRTLAGASAWQTPEVYDVCNRLLITSR
jgi:osmotically-inducible protein OsmY